MCGLRISTDKAEVQTREIHRCLSQHTGCAKDVPLALLKRRSRIPYASAVSSAAARSRSPE
ncbi:hypothetical protein HDC36_001849 [Xanthomonas sp. JAI131]|nr:hypothetical protein [Xanthomonas sp. JAI131]